LQESLEALDDVVGTGRGALGREAKLLRQDSNHGLVHGWRATEKHTAIRARRRTVLSEHRSSDKANTTAPPFRRLQESMSLQREHAPYGVEHKVDLELAVAGEGHVEELVVQEDVVLGDIGKDKGHARPVVGVAQNRLDDLQDRSDPSATRDQTQGCSHVWTVKELSLGPAKLGPIAHAQGVQVARGIALGIGLDEELEVAQDVVEGDGRVAANDLLAVPLCTQLQVLKRCEAGRGGACSAYLADGEVEGGVLVG